MEFDHIDLKILQLLTQNARVQWKDIGKRIHMSGQAVGNRIKKLEDSGAIKGYTLMIDELKLGLSYTAFIIVIMKTAHHEAFKKFIHSRNEIIEAHRISGEGCYFLKAKVDKQESLNLLLDNILKYGNYKLFLSINELKHNHPIHAMAEDKWIK